MPKKEKWEIIAHEYVVSLFPIFMLTDGLYEVRKLIGVSVNLAEVITNNAVTHCHQLKNWGVAHQILVSKIKKNPGFLRKIFSEIKKQGRKQVDYTKKIGQQNLKISSNQKLNSYYQNYIKLNTNLYLYGLILPLLDFQITTFLSDEINKFLRVKKATKYFSLLTTPLPDTFNKIQELNLLRILLLIKKKKSLYDSFKKLESQELIEVLPTVDKNVWYQIKDHTKKYAWVHYVYEGPAANEAYFIDFLRDFVRRKIDPKKELLNHKREKELLAQKQQKILAKLRPDEYYRQLLILARDTVYFKILRRDLQSTSYYYMEPVLAEIGKRLALSLKQVRMMLPEEIAAGLGKGKVDVREVNQRLKSVVYFRQGKQRRILSGQKAIEFSKSIKTEKVDTKLKEIKGTTAQAGKAKGTVKIINSPDEMKKMNQGDILVSGSTNPNLMPAIRKAAAIVTDEGGLTCHAAIVSREFKIPCVVGTNVATQILKDGDRVEVDATKGIIKKI